MLRTSERLCLALILVCAGTCLSMFLELAAAEDLRSLTLGSFVLFFLLVFVLMGQISPLAKARRPQGSTHHDRGGLRGRDVNRLLARAPGYQKLVALAGGAALIAAGVIFGDVSWSEGEPFEADHVMGISLYVAGFASLIYPLLGALARMPASLDGRIRVLQGQDA